MKENVKSITEMVNELAPGQQAEVLDFVEFLLAKKRSRARRKPQFDWAGALKDMRDDYTSVDLQHEITRWRTEVE
jgi:nucleoid DNA-binding protein